MYFMLPIVKRIKPSKGFGMCLTPSFLGNIRILETPDKPKPKPVADVNVDETPFQVSWIRSRDLTILTIGLVRYTRDPR